MLRGPVWQRANFSTYSSTAAARDRKFSTADIADKRVMEGGTALSEARGELNGDTWTVSFTRKLSGGAGDVALQPGKEYNFGFAIHDDHTAGRYHYVPLWLTPALDNPQAGVNAMKQ